VLTSLVLVQFMRIPTESITVAATVSAKG